MYPTEVIKKHFLESLAKFKHIDDNSDVNMFDYFVKHYRTTLLFHDIYHPTNTFMKEIFRQVCKALFDKDITPEDATFPMTLWSTPILPSIQKQLGLTFYESEQGPFTLSVEKREQQYTIAEYYFIRLRKENAHMQ